MRPLNLIPPEDRRGENAPLRAGAVSYAVVGVLAAALVAVVVLVLTSNDINESKSQLAALEARQAQAQAAAQSLDPYTQFATLSTERNQTVSDLARSRFDWERVLRELALVVPESVTLQSLSAAASATDGTSTESGASTGPSLELAGCAIGQEGTAELLAALRDIDGVTRVGMQTSALNDTDGGEGAAAPEGVCQGSKYATFQITVAFDAVPAPATAATGTTPTPAGTTTAAPATTTAAPATTTPAPAAETTSTDGGVAATQEEQAAATESAEEQSGEARQAAGSDAR